MLLAARCRGMFPAGRGRGDGWEVAGCDRASIRTALRRAHVAALASLLALD